MIKYACDRKEDSPYRELSGKLKRVQTARLCFLCASAALAVTAWISRSRGLVLAWVVYCLAVQLAAEGFKGRIYRRLFEEEQREYAGFAERFKRTHGGWSPDRLAFAYRSGETDCLPALCYFGDEGMWALGQELQKYFVAYIGGRMVYAFRFAESGEAVPPGPLRPRWEELPQRHQKYLCAEAEKYGRYLIVENFIYETAFLNMSQGRRNQPCDTVRLLSRMKKETVFGARIGGETWAVPQGTLERLKRAGYTA